LRNVTSRMRLATESSSAMRIFMEDNFGLLYFARGRGPPRRLRKDRVLL
jgi:hypothetical protein